MTDPATLTRYSAHAVDEHGLHDHVVEATSFEAAALTYVEMHSPVVEDEAAVRVAVTDLDDGRQHCFVVDLSSGATSACA